VESKVIKANSKLDRVKILLRGNKLSLRGIFPPKPGDGLNPKRYTISTGLPATEEGLKLTLAKAQQLEIDLLYDRFNWGNKSDCIKVENAILAFEKDYWNTREKNLNRVSNYKKDYLEHFLYLPQDEVVTSELLKIALLNSSQVDTRKRKGRTIAYSALLNFLEIKHDLNKYKGNYQSTKKRKIPTLEEIDFYYDSFKFDWRWVFGIIACYGIRPHEIFHLDMTYMEEYPPVLKVLEKTKTGSRLVYPIPDQKRVIDWNLKEKIMPQIKIEGKSNRELGAKISIKFNQVGIPSPYHFRDAYAIRGEVLNFNPATVAQWMGHELSVHYNRYLRHIDKTHLTEAWLNTVNSQAY
jgi:integrase